MRTFIVKMNHPLERIHLNSTTQNRMDLTARCVIAALWLDHSVRKDVEIIFCFSNNLAVRINGSVRSMSPDERNIISFFNYIQEGRAFPGITLEGKSYEEMINDYKDAYYLDIKGTPIEKVELSENTAFILGDDVGIQPPEKAEKISVGPLSYLTSHCITTLNTWIDKK